eukprot:g21553.t1
MYSSKKVVEVGVEAKRWLGQSSGKGRMKPSPRAPMEPNQQKPLFRSSSTHMDLLQPEQNRLLSPFQIFFSQNHIRSEFQDGRAVDLAVQSIRSSRISASEDPQYEESLGKVSAWFTCATLQQLIHRECVKDLVGHCKQNWVLEAGARSLAFHVRTLVCQQTPTGGCCSPSSQKSKSSSGGSSFERRTTGGTRVEERVVPSRDVYKPLLWAVAPAEDGSQLFDQEGNELYGDREWYTLDNRRLYCLQRAAVSLYPKEVRILVKVVRQEDGSCREFRKFRSTDRGRSIRLGHKDGLPGGRGRDSPDLPRWCWRLEVGLCEELLPAGSPLPRQGRRRERQGWMRRQKRAGARDDESETTWGQHLANASLFVLVYAAMRLILAVWRFYLSDVPRPPISTANSTSILSLGHSSPTGVGSVLFSPLSDAASFLAKSAQLSMAKQDLRDVVFCCNQAVALGPDCSLAWKQRGLARLQLGDFVLGQDMDMAVQSNPTDARLLEGRAAARYGLRDFEGAVDDVTSALEVESLRPEMWQRRGLASVMLEDRKRARV